MGGSDLGNPNPQRGPCVVISAQETLALSSLIPTYWGLRGELGPRPVARENYRRGQNSRALEDSGPCQKECTLSARLEFEFELHYFPVTWSGVRYSTSLDLSFLICIMGMMPSPLQN